MIASSVFPDFIYYRCAEGGAGAAPLEFSDSVGLPLEPSLIFVRGTWVKFGIRDKMKIIAQEKLLAHFHFTNALLWERIFLIRPEGLC